MSRIPLAEPERLTGYLRDLHDGATEEDWSTRHVGRAFAAAPELLEMYLTGFYYPWHTNTGQAAAAARLSPRLKEIVRLRIATLNGCQTCRAARLASDTVSEGEVAVIDDYGAHDEFSPAEKAAIRLAELLATAHERIDDDEISRLREHYDDAEILELMMMAGQYIGFGRVLATLQLETVACPLP